MSNSQNENSTGYRTGFPVIQIQTSTISLQEEMQYPGNNACNEDETMPFQVPAAATYGNAAEEYAEQETMPFQTPPAAANYANAYAAEENAEQETLPFQAPLPVVNITNINTEDAAAEQNYGAGYAVGSEPPAGYEPPVAGYPEQQPFIPSNIYNTPPTTAETTGYAHVRPIAINDLTESDKQVPGYAPPAETTGYARVEQIDLNQQPDYLNNNGYAPVAEAGNYVQQIEHIDLNRQPAFSAGHEYEPPAEVADYAQQVGQLNLYPQPGIPTEGAYAPTAETTGYARVEQIDLNQQPGYLADYGYAPAQNAANYRPVQPIDIAPVQAPTGHHAVPISMCSLHQQPSYAPPQQPKLPPLPPMYQQPPVPQTAVAMRPLGWLVAISGPMMGQAFPITQQVSRIGRAAEMEIALVLDAEVDDEQLHLIYSAQQRTFSLVQAPAGKQITTVSNGNIIHFGPTDIGHGEILNVSRLTALRFIPFCDNTFSWE